MRGGADFCVACVVSVVSECKAEDCEVNPTDGTMGRFERAALAAAFAAVFAIHYFGALWAYSQAV